MTTGVLERERTATPNSENDPFDLVPPPVDRPVPRFRPDRFSPDDLPANDPAWQRLDTYRQEAWSRGITPEELNNMATGYCPAQVSDQIDRLRTWIGARPV